MSDRNKRVFKAKLMGDPIGKDAFDNDLYIGDIIAYAVSGGNSRNLKFGQIRSVKEATDWRGEPYHTISVQTVKLAYDYINHIARWKKGGVGKLHLAHSNAFRIEDIPEPIAAALGLTGDEDE